MKQKLFLVGMPGAGKTTLGKKIATHVHVPFYDVDEEIVRQEKSTIAEIFQQKGEDYFREIESTILKQFCRSSEIFVLATGGGAPCFFDNMATMNRAGITLFLDVPIAELEKRLEKNTARPLLQQGNVHEKLKQLYAERLSFYQQAACTISGNDFSVSSILECINT